MKHAALASAFGAVATLILSGALYAAVPPAPTLAKEVDTAGRPLPFGRPPYLAPETPLGSGARKAIMGVDAALPAHVLYYPANFKQGARLPLVVWGNGACINAGNRFRIFLTEIASHGYLVAASGVMANTELEVGPQENPRVPAPGQPMVAPPPPAAANPNAPSRAPGTTTAAQLTESMDWAAKANGDRSSPFYGRIDTTKVAVMGQSCGGVQALGVAGDPRITTMMIWNSGVGMIPNNPPDPQAVLDSIHSSIAFIHGEQAHDVAYPASVANAKALTKVAVFEGWQDGMTHIGTYGANNGGYFGTIAVAWLDWQLKGDRNASRMFKGADCTLCKASSWHITRNRID
jgi:dienelactone hydrolase